MTNASKTLRTAAFTTVALLLAAPLASTSAIADSNQQTKQQKTHLDETTTGSVRSEVNCNPNSQAANIVCRITRGNPNTKFPSAPVSSLGF